MAIKKGIHAPLVENIDTSNPKGKGAPIHNLANAGFGDWGGLSVIEGSSSATFTGLSDVPSTYVGQAGLTLRVNAGETGLEFIAGVADGNDKHIVRGNSTTGVSPTLLEVPSPINGDTAKVILLDKTLEFWSHNGVSWALNTTLISTLASPDTNTYIENTNGQTEFVVNGVQVGKVTETAGTIKWTLNGILDPTVYAGTPVTIAQRNALVAVAGYLVYVSDGSTKEYQYYDGTTWSAINNIAATETVSGNVELATLAEVETGTDAVRVITPVNAEATYLKKSLANAKGDIIVATADNTFARLAVGANDTFLVADSATATGVKWAAGAAKYIHSFVTTDFTVGVNESMFTVLQTTHLKGTNPLSLVYEDLGGSTWQKVGVVEQINALGDITIKVTVGNEFNGKIIIN